MPAVSTIIPADSATSRTTPGKEPKTVVVMGAARGGTSMVAGLVRMLGIPMGGRIDPPTNEDLDFIEGKEPLSAVPNPKHPEHTRVLERLLGLVNTRNQEYRDWGWKDPLAFVYVAPLLSQLRNPHFVVVFRDLYSISARELLATGVETLDTLTRAQNNYAWLLEVLKRREAPALITGYEKAVLYPKKFAVELCSFLGHDPSKAFLDAAERYIRPGRGHGELPHTSTAPGRQAPEQ